MANTFTYIAFYKPYGVLSQFTSDGGHRTLSEFNLPKGVYSIGRLDKDSEGLLLLTDDGQLKNIVSSPKFNKKKTYYAQVEGIPAEDQLEKLRSGVSIKNYTTAQASIELLEIQPNFPDRDPPIRFRKSKPTTWIKLTISEGKNRQVRRMTAAVGLPTLRLVRTQIENISLNDLELGTFRFIAKSDILIR